MTAAAGIPVTELIWRAGGQSIPLVVAWTDHGDGGRLRVAEVSVAAPADPADLETRKTMVACDWITDGLRRGQTLGEIKAQRAGRRVERLAMMLEALDARGFRAPAAGDRRPARAGVEWTAPL